MALTRSPQLTLVMQEWMKGAILIFVENKNWFAKIDIFWEQGTEKINGVK